MPDSCCYGPPPPIEDSGELRCLLAIVISLVLWVGILVFAVYAFLS